MKYFFVLIPCTALILGCNGNSSNASKKTLTDSTKVNASAAEHIVYTTWKDKDGEIDKAPDSTFVLDSNRITVSVSTVAKGNYVYSDTICAGDSCSVAIYKDRFVHIKIKSPEEKTFVIDKNFIAKSVKDMDFSKCVLGITWIDSISASSKDILFITQFIGKLPKVDLCALYSINVKGELKFIKVFEDDTAGE